jgi:hypothetical protein
MEDTGRDQFLLYDHESQQSQSDTSAESIIDWYEKFYDA